MRVVNSAGAEKSVQEGLVSGVKGQHYWYTAGHRSCCQLVLCRLTDRLTVALSVTFAIFIVTECKIPVTVFTLSYSEQQQLTDSCYFWLLWVSHEDRGWGSQANHKHIETEGSRGKYKQANTRNPKSPNIENNC